MVKIISLEKKLLFFVGEKLSFSDALSRLCFKTELLPNMFLKQPNWECDLNVKAHDYEKLTQEQDNVSRENLRLAKKRIKSWRVFGRNWSKNEVFPQGAQQKNKGAIVKSKWNKLEAETLDLSLNYSKVRKQKRLISWLLCNLFYFSSKRSLRFPSSEIDVSCMRAVYKLISTCHHLHTTLITKFLSCRHNYSNKYFFLL